MKQSRYAALDDPIRQLIARGLIQQEDGRRARRRQYAVRDRERGAASQKAPSRRHLIERQLEREYARGQLDWLDE